MSETKMRKLVREQHQPDCAYAEALLMDAPAEHLPECRCNLPTPDAPQVVCVPQDTACFICAYCGGTAVRYDPPCPKRNGEQCAREMDVPQVNMEQAKERADLARRLFVHTPHPMDDAPQVERFKELYETRLADFKREEAAWNAALEKLRAERDLARAAYRDQHAKTLFEHERAEHAEAEKARLEGELAALREAVSTKADEWGSDGCERADHWADFRRGNRTRLPLGRCGDAQARELRALVDPQGAK